MTDSLSDLPDGWAQAALEDIADVQLGKMLDRAKRKAGTSLPYLRNVNVRWGHFDLSDLLEMPFKAEELERYGIRDGDVLVCEGGEPGRAAVWNNGETRIKYQKALHRIRPFDGIVPQWLVYSLSFDAQRGALDRRFTGTTIKHLTKQAISKYSLAIPPTEEQRRVLSALDEHLSKLDAAVAGLERAQANLKRYRASVLQSAVAGRLVPTEAELAREEGRDYEPAEVLLARILTNRRHRWEEAELERLEAKGKPPTDDKWCSKYKEPAPPPVDDLPELPTGWCWSTVDQLSHEVRYGSSSKTSADDPGIPVLRMGNIVDGALDFSKLKYLPSHHGEFPDLLLNDGDLLFNRTNSAELVGKTAVFHGHTGPCSFASYLIRVRTLTGVAPDFVSAYLNSPHGRDWVVSVVSQQVGQANVNGSKLKACVVPLPPALEQERIVKQVETNLSLVERLAGDGAQGLARCELLRQSVLSWAFAGKLVDQNPMDEPASALLERVRQERGTNAHRVATGRRGRGGRR